ncbi:uncharacterized protein LOC123319806 [Coccinella septempunctata]|uniref:uncharacterized protein LOC123319806 n=1 Tax=Coccinella septempunctata TaxID=41139 RepID=UPI001D099AA7|nr:uncharacterized protein LOC123319806 [Coccinella septempunctata]
MDFNDLEVIDVNKALMHFTCQKSHTKIIINAGLSCTYEGARLPQVATKFDLDRVVRHRDDEYVNDACIISLCHEEDPENPSNIQPDDNMSNLSRIIIKYKLGCSDLMAITKMYEYVKGTVPPQVNLSQFILKYIEDFLSKKEIEATEINCNVQQLPQFTSLTISQCKQIQVQGDMYKEFPYWSFGTRWSLKYEVLIGELFVHPKFGTICLKDTDSTVGCIVVKNFLDELKDIINKPVYIENYCIISEIFNPNNKFNLEYLYVNFDDIHVLENKRRGEFEDPTLKFKMSFLLLNKSNVTYTPEKGYHFWLEIKNLKYYSENINRCFLCLPEQLIEQWPELEASRFYTLKFAKDLTQTRDYEYNRINPRLPQLMLRRNNLATISFNDDYSQPQQLEFLNSETLPRILETTGLVSFQAVLKYRKFNPNNSSRTMLSNIPPIFGTVGEKTHILDFQVDNIKTLAVYLNNWERMATPIGLIPGVLVNVKNVVVQRSYCKSTALTSFEIVAYRPPCKFQTARLLSDDDWGLRYYLGGPNTIPNGVLVHSTINTYHVIKMHLKRSCEECGYMSRIKGNMCVSCKGKMVTICDLLVRVTDKRGDSKITIKKLEMAKAFLGMKDETWNSFLEDLEEIGQYNFLRYDKYVNHALSSKQVKFINHMNFIVKKGEKVRGRWIHLLCRKLDNSRNFKKEEPLWFCVRAWISFHK